MEGQTSSTVRREEKRRKKASGQEEGRKAERGNSGLTMAQSVTPAKWSDTFLLKRVRASRMSPSWKGRGTRISLGSRVVDAAEGSLHSPSK